ncbi:O-methyltransferase [Paenibacillus sp. SC116]|uniref:O-methyltransferase n=1 Tax=Paenibacillus sp. SC116 TaxID=2968986 RepID=UPI00215A962E|nr:O-methyltransferase [Paenibacillus sp. SC116]MCR8843475.1 O-methyltransferase [Paenibacillus sp. SC116]
MTNENLQTVETYLDSHYGEDKQLRSIMQSIEEAGMPSISVAAGYGRLLTVLALSSRAEHALEIGALGGYSGLCILRGLTSGGKLTSLELRSEYAELAHRNLTLAGYGDQVEYRIGEALDSLKQLEEEEKKFDFFFIDADKENYANYLEYAIRLARPGAIIAVDNLLLQGRTMNPEKQGPSVQAMRKFIDAMAHDERLASAMMPAYDGLAVTVVK